MKKAGEETMWDELQTMRTTYQEIAQGERPWNALGDFLNYWFAYASTRREELVQDPIEEAQDVTVEMHQWAVFCAAAVEYLCELYNISCPAWVYNSSFTLSDPWFKGLGAHKPHVQARLLTETPLSFAKRNIYCSPRTFANKYEVADQQRYASMTPS